LIGVVPPDYTNYIILGHVFFTGYNITFSKLTKRIGFSGNLKYLHKIVLFGSNIIEYILFVVLILMIIIGFVQFWKLR
jgi:NAD/NADP transhydrogenase beta subunit